jgi:L-serine dehydratase
MEKMQSDYSVFDIVGPIIIGPSSSHTAGACRLAGAARAIFNKPIDDVAIHVYGSFAATLRGHGTDKALVGGLIGLVPDDERLTDALDLAREAGLKYRFVVEEEMSAQPNLVRFEMRSVQEGAYMSVSGASVGGGNIIVTRINNTALKISLKYNTLVVDHMDRPGAVLSVARILADNQINIASMNMYRQGKHGRAYMILEIDQAIERSVLLELRSLADMSVIYIPQLY